MRYATVVISPGEGGLHPVDGALAADPEVRRDAINGINLLDDGTCVTLYALRGDLRRARDLLDAQPDVLACDVSGDGEGLAYVHFRPNDTVHTLLTITQENEVVLETPIETLSDGGVRVTLVGDDGTIRRAVDDVPGHLQLRLEGIGDYHPELGEFHAALTPRQQEVLETAVELGYYEVPRRTTHEEIADAVGLSAGTVGEHLRKVEGRVLSALVSG